MFHHSYSSAPLVSDTRLPNQPPREVSRSPRRSQGGRGRIAAEERARIVREQEVEALRVQEAQRKAQQQARELQALRIREERRAQLAVRDLERSRALAAQRAELQAHTQRALAPSFRVVVPEGPRTHHCRPAHRSPYPEFHDTVDLTPMPTAAAANAKHINSSAGRVEARREPKSEKTQAPAEAVSVEELLQHVFGGNTAAQPKAENKPAKEAPASQTEAPITIEQLISHFLSAAGVEVEHSKGSTSNATASTSTPVQPSEKKEAAPAPAPSQSASKPAPAPAPTPATAQAPQPVGFEHILNHFLGTAGVRPAAPTQPTQTGSEVDLQQLLNMFLGGAAPNSAPAQPQAGPSNSVSASNSTSAAKKTELQEREERELAEAIRMSLAEPQPQPSPTTNESKGKAPAPVPVKDVASSTAEVHAIDASFAALSSEFVFPAATRLLHLANRLAYAPQNQPLRFYHQALSGLLARLDAVESFGDEELRHGAQGGGKWRRWAGRERASTPDSPAVDEAPVVVTAEDVDPPAAEPVEVADSEPVSEPEFIPEPTTVPEPSPAVDAEQTPSSSYPPASEPSSSYPPSAAESVATLRPSSPAPSSPAPLHFNPVAASPVPSDIDTFLLPASADAPVIQKKPRASDSDADVDVGSDWSEVDA
ncbi:hypothetical protein B0H14DRAFT_3703158 [Mycena olivaceomarginata]|nr:hypothetical protein B0H14DRAFT_3703158 [Mycena olivaceomarginata]